MLLLLRLSRLAGALWIWSRSAHSRQNAQGSYGVLVTSLTVWMARRFVITASILARR